MFGHKGLEAVEKKDWTTAVQLLDKALESSNSPVWLLARSRAHFQLKDYDAALYDAELAYHSAAERGSGNSRKLMIEAQYRRSTIFFRLGRYADADCCAKWSLLLAEGRPAREDDGVEKNVDDAGNYTVTVEDGIADKKGQPGQGEAGVMAGITSTAIAEAKTGKTGFEADWNRAYAWRSQVLGAMKNLPANSPGRKVSVSKIPDKPKKRIQKKPEPTAAVEDDDVKKAALTTTAPTQGVKAAVPAPGSIPDEKMKLRIDFYQNNQAVTVTIFVKDVKKDDLKVEFFSREVRISPVPREAAPYVQAGDREATSSLVLDGNIIPSESRWSVTPRKIELVLRKAVPGSKWGKWGEEKVGSTGTATEPAAEPVAAPSAKENENPKQAPTVAPAYPTSSKSGPKDWDKLGEVGEDDEDKESVNHFFKKLFDGATPEQQRAMKKSFIESNGTSLSTDWSDVGSRTVETIPPEGVEAKKWE